MNTQILRFCIVLMLILSFNDCYSQRKIKFEEHLLTSEFIMFVGEGSKLIISTPLINDYQRISNVNCNIPFSLNDEGNITIHIAKYKNVDTIFYSYELELSPQLLYRKYAINDPGFIDAVSKGDLFCGHSSDSNLVGDTSKFNIRGKLELINEISKSVFSEMEIKISEINYKSRKVFRIGDKLTNYQKALVEISKRMNDVDIPSTVVNGNIIKPPFSYRNVQFIEFEIEKKKILMSPVGSTVRMYAKSIPHYALMPVILNYNIDSEDVVIQNGKETISISPIVKSRLFEPTLHYEINGGYLDTSITLNERLSNLDFMISNSKIYSHLIAEKGRLLIREGRESDGLLLLKKSLIESKTNFERSLILLRIAEFYEDSSNWRKAIEYLSLANENSWLRFIDAQFFKLNNFINKRTKFKKLYAKMSLENKF